MRSLTFWLCRDTTSILSAVGMNFEQSRRIVLQCSIEIKEFLRRKTAKLNNPLIMTITNVVVARKAKQAEVILER